MLELIQRILEHLNNEGFDNVALAEIVTEPKGHVQTSDIEGVDQEWIDQRGDEAGGFPFYGDVYIELTEGKFGRFTYAT